MFHSIVRRPKSHGLSGFSPSKAESAGYIPPKIQIENMILAGKRLDDARKEQYDFGPDDKIDENFVDPTRNPNFDMADASALADQVKENLQASAKKRDKAIAESKAKAEAERDALIEKGRKAVEAEETDG